MKVFTSLKHDTANVSSLFCRFQGIDAKGFSDKAMRRKFIRKVYSLLSVQLFITGVVVGLCLLEPIKKVLQDYPLIILGVFIAWIVVFCVLLCGGNIRRKVPQNLILLFVFTVLEGITVGLTASYYDTEAVVIAFVLTVVVFLGLTAFAFQTKIDFTKYYLLIFVVTLTLALVSIPLVIVFIIFRFWYLDLVWGLETKR